VGPEERCQHYRRVIEQLHRLSSTPGYIDRRGGLTSEGRAYLASIARYMARNRLGCLEILWQVRDRPEKLESLYQCVEANIEKCGGAGHS